MTGTLTDITPLIPVSDIDDAVAFFADTLGFEPRARMEGYAHLVRDAVAVRLVSAAPDADMSDPARQNSCYVDVTGIDALYESLRPTLDKLPPAHVRAPFNQDYGQREFHVIYESLLIFFGEAVTVIP